LEAIKQSVSNFPLIVHDLENYVRNKCDHFHAGCISKFIDNWQEITSDREILTTARGAAIELDATPYCMMQPADIEPFHLIVITIVVWVLDSIICLFTLLVVLFWFFSPLGLASAHML